MQDRFVGCCLGVAIGLLVPQAGAQADDQDVFAVLDQLLVGAQQNVDYLDDAIARVHRDPERYAPIRVGGQVMVVDRNSMAEQIGQAALVISAVIEESPTAAALVGEQLGRRISATLSPSMNQIVPGLADLVGIAAQSFVGGSSLLLSEGRIAGKLQGAVDQYLLDNALPPAQLDAELAHSRAVYEAIDLLIGEMNGAGEDQPAVADADRAGLGCEAFWNGDADYQAGWTWYSSMGVGSHNYEVGGVLCFSGSSAGYYTVTDSRMRSFACDEDWLNCNPTDDFVADVTEVTSDEDVNGPFTRYDYRTVGGGGGWAIRRAK